MDPYIDPEALDPAHPLTPRVAANHVWQHLFGAGLVATPENFGRAGTRPRHPELLDWLASEYVRLGWSRKALIRTIVLSATYQQSSATTPAQLEADPDNHLLARGPQRAVGQLGGQPAAPRGGRQEVADLRAPAGVEQVDAQAAPAEHGAGATVGQHPRRKASPRTLGLPGPQAPRGRVGGPGDVGVAHRLGVLLDREQRRQVVVLQWPQQQPCGVAHIGACHRRRHEAQSLSACAPVMWMRTGVFIVT